MRHMVLLTLMVLPATAWAEVTPVGGIVTIDAGGRLTRNDGAALDIDALLDARVQHDERGRVLVLTVEGGTVPGPSGEEVAGHLARHGITVSARTVEPAGRTTGEAILAEAAAFDADLILKGAYTHSRLREMIFGGATRHILNAAELPVLMAH